MSGCINGNSGFGGWISCDYYAVIGKEKRGISGTVLDNTGKGLANATVTISGPGGTKRKRTDPNGDYGFEVDPGNYSVSVRGSQARVTRCTPGSASGARCSLDLNQDDGTANFEICGASAGPSRDTARAASNAPCPLDVTVVRTDGSHSGLAFGDPPTYLMATNPDAAPPNSCVSGCVDLLVTVTDPARQHQGVAGATVSASVTPISNGIAPYPDASADGAGTGHLCLADQPGNCGKGRNSFIEHLTTNKNGELVLRYWAPGLIENATVTVSVKAETTCGPKICASQKESKTVHHELTVFAKPIFQSESPLTSNDAGLIFDWRQAKGLITLSGQFIKHFATEEDQLLPFEHILAAFEKELPPQVTVPLAFVTFGIEKLRERRVEEQLFAAMFAELLGLQGAGIGDADALLSDALPGGFVDAVALSHGDQRGLMYDYGEALQDPRSRVGGEQLMKLRVFEVSYCDVGAICGPGYTTGSGVNEARLAGIHPFLYFDFEAGNSPDVVRRMGPFFKGPVFKRKFLIPYNAGAWMYAQLHKR